VKHDLQIVAVTPVALLCADAPASSRASTIGHNPTDALNSSGIQDIQNVGDLRQRPLSEILRIPKILAVQL
jgi:hypothetical protein